MGSVIGAFFGPTPVPGCTGLNLIDDFGGSFAAWANYQAALDQDLTLCVPAGTYDALLSKMVKSYPGSTVQGQGGLNSLTTIENGNIFGGGSIYGRDGFGNGNSATSGGPYQPRIASVAAGATTVEVISSFVQPITAAPTGFTAGDRVIICGFDVMGFGFPINNLIFEYNTVVSVTDTGGGTGTVDLLTPLINSYDQDWPLLWGGDSFHPDEMGTPGIQRMHPDWVGTFVLRGVNFRRFAGGQIGGSFGQTQIFEDVDWSADSMAPSCSETITFTDCAFDAQLEVDKMIDRLEFYNCTQTQFTEIQSSSVNTLIMDGCDFNTMNGTGRDATISNCHFNNCNPGPVGYGATTREVICDNVVVDNVPNVARAATLPAATTLVEGLITAPTNELGNMLIQLCPGGWYTFKGSLSGGGSTLIPPAFTVITAYESGTDTVYVTDIPEPCAVWDSATINVLQIVPLQAPWFTVTNTTEGAYKVASYAAAAQRPYQCYWQQSIEGFLGVKPFVQMGPPYPMFGYLEEIRINVTKAYTGVRATLTLKPFYEFQVPIVHEDGTHDTTTLRVHVNLKTVGERVLTSGLITGTQPGDTLATWTGDHEWMTPVGKNGAFLSAAINTEDPSVWPEATITFKSTLHIPPPP